VSGQVRDFLHVGPAAGGLDDPNEINRRDRVPARGVADDLNRVRSQ